MAQKPSWSQECPERIAKRLSTCTGAGLRAEEQNDPTKFVVVDRQCKKFRCRVGNPHICSCTTSQPCIHILFVLISLFKISRTNAAVWQSGVSELELSDWVSRKSVRSRCIFCHEAVAAAVQCESCGVQFHERCLKLAALAGKCRATECPRCHAAMHIKETQASFPCQSCHRPCRNEHYSCMLCSSFVLCPTCYRSSNTHSLHPFSHSDANSTFPASTTAMPTSLGALQYREINPEDYETLVALDSAKHKKLSRHELSCLPVAKFKVSESINICCPVCQQTYSSLDACLVLPCGHTMHRRCGLRWLSEYSDECPIDHISVFHASDKVDDVSLSKHHVRDDERRNRSDFRELSTANALSLPPIVQKK